MSRNMNLSVSLIYKVLWFTLLVTRISALSLLELLQGSPELSTLYARVNSSTNLTNFLSASNDFTLLAPSNNAFAKLPAGTSNLTDDQFTAMLQYSLLRGTFPKLTLTTANQFTPSNLNNSKYANVTGGQVAGLRLDNSGDIAVLTGNKSISTSAETKVCVGGIVHVMNDILTIPYNAVDEITAAGLEYFLAILAKGNFLTTGASYVNPVIYKPNITLFIPNSPDALANFTQTTKTATPADLQSAFLYHVVPDFLGYSPLLTQGLSLKTLAGANLTIHVQGNETYVNGAKVLSTDHIIANGVIHVIDNVLNATNTTGPPPAATTSISTPSSTASDTPTETPPPSSTAVAASKSSSSLSSSSTGKTVGIAVGAGAGGIILLAIIVILCLRRRKHKDREIQIRAWNGPMPELAYEGPTGDALYANRYTVKKDADSRRFTTQRDSVVSLSSSGSPQAMQAQGFPMPIGDVPERYRRPPPARPQRPDIPQRSPSRNLHGGMFDEYGEKPNAAM